MNGVIEGRIVHYVLPNGKSKGEHRPAIIVKVWSHDCVNLQVFTDFTNDFPFYTEGQLLQNGQLWATSVVFDEENKNLGTWHWIEKA